MTEQPQESVRVRRAREAREKAEAERRRLAGIVDEGRPEDLRPSPDVAYPYGPVGADFQPEDLRPSPDVTSPDVTYPYGPVGADFQPEAEATEVAEATEEAEEAEVTEEAPEE